MVKLRFLLPLLFLGALTARAQTPPVSIDIVSSWASFNVSGSHSTHIALVHGRYVRDGKPVDRGAVAALMAAIEAPALPQPDLANLGIDQAWLAREAQTPDERVDFANLAPNQQALYRKLFTDPKNIQDVVARTYQRYINDYFPETDVTLTFADKSTVKLETVSFSPFLLPWRVTSGAQSSITYNADISRALAAMLPPADEEVGLLDGSGLAAIIKLYFRFRYGGQWTTLGVQNQAGPDIARLQERYAVLAAGIVSEADPMYDSVGDNVNQTSLKLSLHRTGSPAHVSEEVALPFAQGRSQGLEGFLAKMADYESLALSPPWLSRYLQAHPDTDLRLSYLNTGSLSDAALRTFTDDMRVAGKAALAADVAAMQDKVVLLISGNLFQPAFWLVLPDRRMVLWRYGMGASLLNWPDTVAARTSCAHGFYGFCSGAIVSPDGDFKQ